MSLDINAVVTALFAAGAASVRVKDFHRTGYNLITSVIHPGAQIDQGYHAGPVPGVGDPGECRTLMMIGMHAASGTAGFIPHTLTSRISSLVINGCPTAEVSLFAASLAPFGLRPAFFSGCPRACRQALSAMPEIHTHAIDKSGGLEDFDAVAYRHRLAEAAVASLSNDAAEPFDWQGPFDVRVTFRNGPPAARQIGDRWGYQVDRDMVLFRADHFREMYMTLIRICYLTPLREKILPFSLGAFNAMGRLGLAYAKMMESSRIRSLRHADDELTY